MFMQFRFSNYNMFIKKSITIYDNHYIKNPFISYVSEINMRIPCPLITN